MLPTVSTLPNQHLVPAPLWNRLVSRVEKDEHVPQEKARRIVDSTLGFLDICAKNPEQRFSPSPLVDVGWHTFILYTKDYADFCRKNAGRFIHHEPNDNPVINMKTGGACATVAFMKEHEIPYDDELWRHPSAECTVDCDGGTGPCHNSKCTCS